MASPTLHKHEIAILYVLRHSRNTRYSELLHKTNLENDTFKFYLQKLLRSGYIEKEEGLYGLTIKGKEFANNLDRTTQTMQKQPKLSLILVVSRERKNEEIEYLFQKRLRHPYFDWWGFLSGPAKWGIDFETTASHELAKQTRLTANFSVSRLLRTFDQKKDSSELLEDKLFIVLYASNPTGTLSHEWSGGESRWMSLSELKREPKYFEDSLEIATFKANEPYSRSILHYNESEY